jgi:hypothetical protein
MAYGKEFVNCSTSSDLYSTFELNMQAKRIGRLGSKKHAIRAYLNAEGKKV